MLDSAAVIAPCLLLALQSTAPSVGVQLPDSAAARAWHSTSVEAPPVRIDEATARLAGIAAWNEGATWQRWADDLAAERGAEEPDPARRTRLALAALSHARSEQAWEHFAALSGHGDWMRPLLPRLLPGAPLGTDLELGLPDGVTLTPALPPLARPTAERTFGTGRLERREMKLVGLKIGAALVDLRIGVEYDGVQIDVEFKGGEAADLLVVIPEPLDFELSTAYVDWEREPRPNGPHAVHVSAETPLMTVYGRCRPLRISWPTTLPASVDQRVRSHGFELQVRPADELAPLIEGFARAVQTQKGVPARVVVVEGGALPAESSALTLHLAAAPDRPRKLRGLVWAAEQFALRR